MAAVGRSARREIVVAVGVKPGTDRTDDGRMNARLIGALWAVLCVALPAAQLLADDALPGTAARPVLLFWIVVLAASQCVLLAVGIVVYGFRRKRAEPALLGAFLLSVSLLPLAHGILTPGVLYGPNEGTTASVQFAVLIGALALLPFALHRSNTAGGLAVRWRPVVLAHVALTAALFSLVLVEPDLVPAVETGSPAAAAVALGSLAVCLALSWRHRRLAVIAGSSSMLGVAIGLILVGSAPLVFLVGEPYGAGFWLAHAFDIVGVTAVSISALVGYRRSRTMEAVLSPIEVATPLEAVEIGLDPVIHQWVAALDAKDEQTRDHVVRTARLAVQVATEMGLSPSQIRQTGIGAILHDVGKLDIPSEILTKPGRLTDDERAIMETHAALGAAKLLASPVLAAAAPIVAAHHERVDGRGYPRGLSADDIPVEAKIIAACDAYDAITNNRHYRKKMSRDRAAAILREHAGSQWDAHVVDSLLRLVQTHRVPEQETALESVGRDGPPTEADVGWVCHDAVPDDIEAKPVTAAAAASD